MTTERIICIAVESFAMLAVLDSPADRNRYPLVVAESDNKTAPVLAANDLALQDVSLGMTVAQASARCNGLRVLLRDSDREDTLSRRILRLLQRVSPTVESNGAGCFYIDSPGLVRLYNGERGIADKIRATLRHTNLPIRIGIAGNKLTARIAARLDRDSTATIVPPGNDRLFLAPLPITALPVSDDTKEKLLILGLKKISDIAAMPAQEITRRFGDDVLALAKFVRGEDPTLYLPDSLYSNPGAATRLDYSLTTKKQLCQHIEKLLSKLLIPLNAIGSGSRTITLSLSGEHQPPVMLRLSARTPTASVCRWMRQIEQALAQQQSLGPITDIGLILKDVVSIHSEQLPLPTYGPSRKQLPVTDNQRVQSIHLCSSVLPERSFILCETPRSGKEANVLLPPYYTERRILGLRLYRLPLRVRVTTSQDQIVTLQTEPVVRQAGPWHVSGYWWDESFSRWYFDITTAAGNWFLLFYDGLQRQWFLQGVFD
jgi:nucleotidyltransferase/DNA polymerase involved in DNA repair